MSIRKHFPLELPLVHTKYCFNCGSVNVQKVVKESDQNLQTSFICSDCNKESDRVRIWDPQMIQYFDDKDNLVHEGAGVIVQNQSREILFFLRTKYPFLWTIPGGHMSPGENTKAAALRELEEEVGLVINDAQLIFEGIINGDECMGGADIHKWYLYHALVDSSDIILNDEGSEFSWFKLSDVPKNCTFPVQYLLQEDSVIKALK